MKYKKYNDAVLMKIVRPVITLIFKFIYNPQIIGEENIPKNKKIILAGNHTSNFDCLLLISSCKRNIHFLAKDELWKGPKKIIFNNLGLIPVNRKIKDKKCLIEARKYLENNKLICIFPEGTINKTKDKLMSFKIGSVKLASDTDTEIIPFAISGKYKIFTKDLKIVFGKPIKTTNVDLEVQNDKLRNSILKML